MSGPDVRQIDWLAIVAIERDDNNNSDEIVVILSSRWTMIDNTLLPIANQLFGIYASVRGTSQNYVLPHAAQKPHPPTPSQTDADK